MSPRARAAVLAMLVAALAGCTSTTSEAPQPNTPLVLGGSSGDFGVRDVVVHGKTVTCVTWLRGYGGGMSCDWEHAQ